MKLIPWLKKENNSLVKRSNVFDKLWDDFFWDKPFLMEKSWSGGFPSIDISEDDKSVSVKAELPGMSEKDVELTYDKDGVLNIKGEKKEEHEEKGKNKYHRESWYGSFSRNIPLGKNLDWEQVNANYKKGTLTVSIPKKENTEDTRKKLILTN